MIDNDLLNDNITELVFVLIQTDQTISEKFI